MANHASAIKAHRQSLKRKQRNRSNRSALRSTLKNFSERLESGKPGEALSSLPQIYATVDKAVQKKVLSANAAARHKSRLTKRLSAAQKDTGKA
jgi:small subunit ribosomal protein S20